MDFGEILTKAWKTIWKHKILWLFGILAGCGASSGGGGGGGGGSTAPGATQSGTWDGPSFLSPSAQRGLEDFFQTLADIPVWVWVVIAIGVLVLIFILSVLFLMVGTLGTTGVIKGTGMADDADEDAKPLSLGAIFKGLKPHYWKVFLLNIGLRVVGFILTIIFALPIILFAVCTCFLGLFLLVPIGWFINLMVNFTTIAIVEEGKGIFEGIGQAWQVITRHLGNVVVMFLILGIGQLVIGLIIGLPMIFAFAPLLINLVVTGFQQFAVGLIISGILFLIFLPILIILGGMLRAYVLASWTLTYRRLTGESALNPTVLFGETSQDEEA